MAEYIEREAFRQLLVDRQITTNFFDNTKRNEDGCIIDLLDKFSAADVAPVRHGRWMNANSRPKTYERRCTACGGRAYFCGMECSYKYCPNCGCRMDRGNDK